MPKITSSTKSTIDKLTEIATKSDLTKRLEIHQEEGELRMSESMVNRQIKVLEKEICRKPMRVKIVHKLLTILMNMRLFLHPLRIVEGKKGNRLFSRKLRRISLWLKTK